MLKKLLIALFVLISLPLYAQNGIGGGSASTRPLNAEWLSLFSPSGGTPFTQNAAVYYEYQVTAPVLVSSVVYGLNTADNTGNLYDIGIYGQNNGPITSDGSLTLSLIDDFGVALAGTTFSPSAGVRTQALAKTIQLRPGTYVIAITTNCTSSCALLDGSSGLWPYSRAATSGNTTSGGLLSSTISVGASVFSSTPSANVWFIQLHN